MTRRTIGIRRTIGPLLLAAARRVKAGGVIINEHTLSAAHTRGHVDALGRWFDFVHHDELLDRLERPRARPFCLLTFDDGKRSNVSETAPELTRLGVPAVFYVVTRFLSDGKPLWFDEYTALVRAVGAPPPGLERDVVKQLPFALLQERLRRALDRAGVRADLESDDVRPMSWDDARRLATAGFTIGAHSLTHAVLTREPEAAALADIRQSIAEVAAELRQPCASFAFPNGNYTARLARAALECGARTVMTTEPLWADRSFPPWRLPRIQLFGVHGWADIDVKLALAATGRVLQNPDGTERLYRRVNRAARRPGGTTP